MNNAKKRICPGYLYRAGCSECLSNISKNEEIFCTALLTANIPAVNFLISSLSFLPLVIKVLPEALL